MKKVSTLAALLFTVSCTEPTPAPPPPGAPVHVVLSDAAERTNLFNIAHGASVISRTAELTLDHSAILVIDGDPATLWTSPEKDQIQTLTFALPAPAKIVKLGARLTRLAHIWTPQIRFETSADGRNFSTAAIHTFERKDDDQLFDIPPTVAQVVRLTTLQGGTVFSAISSLHARGEFTSRPSLQPLAGCWTVNGLPAAFAEQDGHVWGTIGTTDPIRIEGGREGLVYRFAWSREPAWGIAMVTISPDGQNLTGIKWFELASAHAIGDSWFGDRTPCSAPRVPMPDGVARNWLRQSGRYPLYAIDEEKSERAVATISAVLRALRGQRMKLIAREFREATPELNRKRAGERMDRLRAILTGSGIDAATIDFEVLGADRPAMNMITESMRVMNSAIEIEIPEPARSSF